MADTIKLGNIDISAFKVGSADCKVYLGSVKLYPQTASSYKLQATYSDSSTYDLSCDSSTTLVQSEVRSGSSPYSAMTSAVIGGCVTEIGNNAFYQLTSLSSIVITNSVTTIDENAFYGCSSLSSVTIPTSVTSIGRYSFAQCAIPSVTIPSGVTSISEGTFEYCSNLTNVAIQNGVTSIGSYAFSYCSSLSSVTIPSSVTSIGGYAFRNCSSLLSVTIPNSVTNIGARAFRNCTSLSSMTIYATTPPTLDNTNALQNTNDCPIYVPSESVETYKAASGWSTYASRIQAIPNS